MGKVFATTVKTDGEKIALLEWRTLKAYSQEHSWVDHSFYQLSWKDKDGSYEDDFNGESFVLAVAEARSNATTETITKALSSWLIYAAANKEEHRTWYEINDNSLIELLEHPLIVAWDEEQSQYSVQQELNRQAREVKKQNAQNRKRELKEFPLVDKKKLVDYLNGKIDHHKILEPKAASCRDYGDAMKHDHYREAFELVLNMVESGSVNADQ